METFEQTLQSDRKWLFDEMGRFGDHLIRERMLDRLAVSEKTFDFRTLMAGIAFGEDIDGKARNKKIEFSYHQFDLKDQKQASAKERANILDFWLKFLNEYLRGHEEEESKVRRQYLRNLLIKETEAFLAKPDETREIFISKIGKGPRRYKAIVKDENPAIINKVDPVIHAAGTSSSATAAGSSAPSQTRQARFFPNIPVYKPGFPASSVIALAAGFASSYAVKGASSAAIAWMIGTVGLPALPAIIASSALYAVSGALAGGASYAAGSLVRNFNNVARETMDAAWKNKPGMFFRSWGNSMDKKEFRNRMVMGAAGGGLGFLLHHAGDLAPFVPEPAKQAVKNAFDALGFSGWAGADQLQSANTALQEQLGELRTAKESLEVQVGGLLTANDALQEQVEQLRGTVDGNMNVIGTQQGQIDALKSEINSLKESLAASQNAPAVNTSHTVPLATNVPSYVTGDTSGSVQDILNNAAPSPVTDEAVGSALDTTPAGLTPENAEVVVKSGDNLTKIIEDQYNVDELSSLDSDNDGIRDFDEIMAAVAKANGLDGNQQNWLKVNWKLMMPTVDVANAADNINRPALDANWRAGDISFSNVPKMAP